MRIQPNADELALDLKTHLENLEQSPDGTEAMCRGWYVVGHYRAAVRRALFAEGEARRLQSLVRGLVFTRRRQLMERDVKLETVEQHNARLRDFHKRMAQTGVACPHCGTELCWPNGVSSVTDADAEAVCPACGTRQTLLI